MDFRLLGPLEVVDDDGREIAVRPGRQRALLALLLLRANELVSSDVLVEQLWGGSPPPTAHKMLQNQVSALRRALGANGRLETRGSGYRLRLGEGERDVDRFEQLVARGRARLESNPEGAAAAFGEALGLWRGPALADLAYESFAPREVARLEDERVAALEQLVEAELALGRHAEVVGRLEELVSEHPYRERLRAQLMLALYRCDRQAEALRAYQDARRKLVEDLGIEPGERLRELERAMLVQDPALAAPAPEPVELPLELDTGTPLAGREAELDWLRERWRRAHGGSGLLVLVAGARGMGKTRLAAELAAELHRDRARVLYVSGAGPLEAAREVLSGTRASRRPTLLVLDDADRADDELRAALSELVGRLAAMPVLVLATAEDPALAAVLRADATLTLAPLDEDGVRAVAQLYAGARDDVEIPVERLAAASGGVPRGVHRAAGEWGRYEAGRRLGAAAGRAASGRTALRTAEDDLAGDVVELEAVRERAELLGGEPRVVECPFKGLASFDVEDAEVFFGRERLVAELVARLAGAPLMGIVGSSGSGKSSALRAGLLAALAAGVLPGSDGWGLALLRPGAHPRRALERATAGAAPGRRLVLAVDQFEEVFTACRDEPERTAFVDALVRAARDPLRRALVLVAIRADFYGRCAVYPELSRLLGANHVLVGPMRRDELRRAIELPARHAGLYVESGLVDDLIADVEGEPGALPLLSTALLELWQQRDGRRLTMGAYEASGGVRGAVARLAEAAYARLESEQRPVARSLLLRLAGEGEGTEVVRRRVPLDELDPKADSVLAVLADARLVTVSQGAAEVAHEALLREWPRLRGWLDDDVHGRRLHHHLAHAAREWDAGGRDPGELYRGARLDAALDWSRDHDDQLNRLERTFLDASEARRRGERAARRRRIRLAFAGLTTALVAITVVAVVAVYEGREADRQRDIATSRALAANAMGTLTADPGLSLALARRAVSIAPTAEATAALRQAVLDFRALAVMRAGREPVYGVDLSRDGRRAVSASRDGKLRVWNLADSRAILTTRVHRDHAYSPRFSPDERWVASGGADGIVALTDGVSGRRRVLIRQPGATASTVAWARDGSLVASGYTDGTIRIAEIEGDAVRVLEGHRDVVSGVAISENDRWLASASWDGTVRLWDLRERSEVLILRSNSDEIGSIGFSPDGRRLIGGDGYGWINFWSVPDGRLEKRVRAGDQPIYAARFSPDGQRLASVGDDGAIRVIDVASGRVTAVLRGHSGTAVDVRFSADGDRVISAGLDGTVRLWDPGTTRLIRGRVSGVTFSADGQRLVAGGTDGTIRLWGIDGSRDGELRGHTSLSRARFSPDGRQVISASIDGTVRIWNASGGRARREFRDNGRQAYAASFDRHARRFVSGGWNGRVVVRSLTGKRTVVLSGHERPVRDVAFSPNDRQVISAGDDGSIRIWDAQQASRPLTELRGHRGGVRAVAFSPDGRRVVSAGDDGTVRVWTRDDGGHVVLRGHDGPVESARFNSSGDRVVSAGFDDGSVRVWDSRGGPPLATLHQYRHSASSAMFSPDGSQLLSAGDDSVIRLSTCEVCGSLDSVLRLARTRTERPFSAEERQRFLAAN